MSHNTRFDLELGEAGRFVSELLPSQVRELINVTGFQLEDVVDAYVAHNFEYELPDQPLALQREVIDQVKHFQARGTWMSRSGLLSPPQSRTAQGSEEIVQPPGTPECHNCSEQAANAPYCTPVTSLDEDMPDWVDSDNDNMSDMSLCDSHIDQNSPEPGQHPAKDSAYPSPGSEAFDPQDATMDEIDEDSAAGVSEIGSRSPSLSPSLHRLNLREGSVESEIQDLHLPVGFQFPELASPPEEDPTDATDASSGGNIRRQYVQLSDHAGSQSFMMGMSDEMNARDATYRDEGMEEQSLSRETTSSPGPVPEDLQELLVESEALAAQQHFQFDDDVPVFERFEEDELPEQANSNDEPMQDWTTDDAPWHDLTADDPPANDIAAEPSQPEIIDLTDETDDNPSTIPSPTSLHSFSSVSSSSDDDKPLPSTPHTPIPSSVTHHWQPAEIYIANRVRKIAQYSKFTILAALEKYKEFKAEIDCAVRELTHRVDTSDEKIRELREENEELREEIGSLKGGREKDRKRIARLERIVEELYARHS